MESYKDLCREGHAKIVKKMKRELQSTKIKCWKYNNAFGQVVESVNKFQSRIKLDSEGKEFVVLTKRFYDPANNLDETDEEIVKEESESDSDKQVLENFDE